MQSQLFKVESRVITPSSDEWPDGLTRMGTNEPVFRLHVMGEPLPSDQEAIAVVGTRRPTSAGIDATRLFVRALVQNNFVIVSGLAHGIDSVAHRVAIEAGGRTVAVVGAGLDVNYPRRNERLRQEILEHRGSLVSEYPLGTQPEQWHFPARNRIIACLSRGVLVIEGGLRSGALITAHRGFDAGRDIWALAGSFRNPMAAASHDLVRKGEAALVGQPKDMFDDIAPRLVWDQEDAGNAASLGPEERSILLLLDDVPVVLDHLARLSGLDLGRSAMALSRLEVRGWARRRSVGYEITEAGARIRELASDATP